jgi:hypothetical protein
MDLPEASDADRDISCETLDTVDAKSASRYTRSHAGWQSLGRKRPFYSRR